LNAGKAVIQHLSERCDFRVLPGSAEALVRWCGKSTIWLPTFLATFLPKKIIKIGWCRSKL